MAPAPDRRPVARPESNETPLAGLYLVATPIGNLRDIGLRALDVLANVDAIACEDTRVTAKLLSAHRIATRLIAYHEHNAARARPQILARLARGEAVALVSDAGTPLISDPGYKLVQAAREAQFSVTAVPGASAVLTALTLSGLPTDRFYFGGFVPSKAGQRQRFYASMAAIPSSLVLFETAGRLVASLADAAAGLGSRPAAVTRELTKRFEQVHTGTLPDLATHYRQAGPPKGEIVLVIGPPDADADPASDEALDALLREALAHNSLRDAVDLATAETGRQRRDVYRRALAIGPTDKASD